jgi:hypothetical protein
MKQMFKLIKFSKFILDGGSGRYRGKSAHVKFWAFCLSLQDRQYSATGRLFLLLNEAISIENTCSFGGRMIYE